MPLAKLVPPVVAALACASLALPARGQQSMPGNPVVLPHPLACSQQDGWVCEADTIYQGSQEDHHRGWKLSAGDLDGDGERDVLAGAAQKWDSLGMTPGTRPLSVAVYLSDPAADCRSSPDVLVKDTLKGDHFGLSVAFVGDLDGDGAEDFVAGAPRGPCNGTGLVCEDRGRVYVFLSTNTPWSAAGGTPSFPLAPVGTDVASVVIEGEGVGHRFGLAVSRAGDFLDPAAFDGDPDTDLPDIAVGAPFGHTASSWRGRLYVLDGEEIVALAAGYQPGQPVVVGVGSLVASYVREGLDVSDTSGVIGGDRYGWSIARARVVPRGRDWLIVGAIQSEHLYGGFAQWGTPGYVEVLQGAGGPILRFDGRDPDGWFGSSVDGNLDVNKDGEKDVLVGAPRNDVAALGADAGRAYVLSSKTGILRVIQEVVGTQAGEQFGHAVARLGKVNGDAYPDWAVGSYGYDAAPTGGECAAEDCFEPATCQLWPSDDDGGSQVAGRTYVVNGAFGTFCHTLYGEDGRDSAGSALVGLGDISGNGRVDLAIGAGRFAAEDQPALMCSPEPPNKEIGRVYVFHF